MDTIRKNEIIAVLLFAISLFLFLSIFTFNEQDLTFYTSDPNLSPSNLTGIAGSYIGLALLFAMGRAAYVIPLLILVWGISRLMQIEGRKVFFRFFGTVVLVVAVSSILSMLADSTNAASFARGGLIGLVVSTFLVTYLGKVGALVFITAMIILSLLVATEFLILPMLMALIRFLKGAPGRVKGVLPEKAILSAMKPREAARKRINAAKEEIARKLDSMKRQVEAVKKTPLADAPQKVKTAPAKRGSKAEPRIVSSAETVRAGEKQEERVAPVFDVVTGEKVEYKLPSLDLLKSPSKSAEKEKDDVLKTKAVLLEKTLLEFGVEASVVKINRGPVITMFELEPAMGTKVNKITSLSDNISLAMRSSNIRIVAPLPGKGTIGIEVPNAKSELVLLREIMESGDFVEEDSPLKIALGKDISGAPVVLDLGGMPHLLIAGATGSGKTVCINAVITSFLINSTPEEIKFLMVDPKRVELMIFEGIPHLLSPIVTNPKKVAAALGWVVGEMERRYDIFAEKGVRNITAYKERAGEEWENLPYIVVIIDELADLMAVSQQDIEGAIMRLAQLSRAAGIHMIIATQRPSVNVITGVIKANFPARISFKVASKVDSRTVLDANGAEKLLGRGDMLIMEPGASDIIRGQCSLVEDGEIRNIVKFIKAQAGPRYIEEIAEKQESRIGGVEQEKDDLYREAVKMVVQTKQASVSMIQRRFRVGYTRAARMIDIMESEGIVGPYNGSKPRDILVEDVESLESRDVNT